MQLAQPRLERRQAIRRRLDDELLLASCSTAPFQR